MRACFADTFYFIALLNNGDPHHARAMALNASMDTRIDEAGGMWI